MQVGVPKERAEERRVALVPAVLPKLRKQGLEIMVEAGAGVAAGFSDDEYRRQGAEVVADQAELYRRADLITRVRTGGADPQGFAAELGLLRPGQVVIGLCDPLTAHEQVSAAAQSGITLLSLEMMPRITRAQSMDVLSSMATIAGYKAVLLAADRLPKLFPMLMTAAGTITPARVLVIGAGVAGLQAIATARRLGAVVEAYDVRPAVREQVESLGAKFVQLELDAETAEDSGGYAQHLGDDFYERQRRLMSRIVAAADVVITTAAVPGKTAPVLVSREMVEGMQPGSVIVDLAAERGGNCELTRLGAILEHHGVTILGPRNLPATVAHHASQMFARNVASFLAHLAPEGGLRLDLGDEIVAGTLITHDGRVVHPRLLEEMALATGESGDHEAVASSPELPSPVAGNVAHLSAASPVVSTGPQGG